VNLGYFQAMGTGQQAGRLARYTDILLVAALVAIVALMIVPLPTWVIDVLVAVNIAGGMLLLLLAIYVSNPLEFSAFPSVLLISTLFRLSLSITSSTPSATWWRAATWWSGWWCS
jgi:type III secretion protein V